MKSLKHIFDYQRAVRDKNEIQQKLIEAKRKIDFLNMRLIESEEDRRGAYSAYQNVSRENIRLVEENKATAKDVLAGIRAVGKALRGE